MSSPKKLQSNYWKISHQYDDFSTFHIPTNTSLSKDHDTIAVGSNHSAENLKIYQLSTNSLIHLASITLPDIQSLKFLKPVSPPPHNFKFLITGHSNGIAHLSAIPLSDNSVFQNAEIIKRLNHKKHIKQNSNNKPFYNNNNILSTTISSIELTTSSWSSIPLNSLVSVYDNYIFLWDTSRSRAPLSITRTNGTTSVSLNNNMDSVAAIVGDYGLSLLDLRIGKRKDKSSLYLPPKLPTSRISSDSSLNNYSSNLKYKRRCNGFTSAQWCETNCNYITTVQSDIVYIWDIRKMEPFSKLSGFSDSVTQVKWKGDTIWTGDKDGNLINWNVKNVQNLENMNCTISSNSDAVSILSDSYNNSTNSTNYNYNNNNNNNNSHNNNNNKSYNIPCGNSTKVSNSKIISMELDPNSDGIICLDSVFLSTHELENSLETYPRVVEKVLSTYSNKEIDSHILPDKTESTDSYSLQHSNFTTQIFDSPSSSRKTSNESCSPTTQTFQLNEEGKNNVSGDYLEFFQKEIDEMIDTIDHINFKHTIHS
ncbi:hypothetical protein C6P40_004366 [Pichia californica]|uniref:Protein DSE1 n=1 Tax=Pichia californica TaxID=460514 RepID=A0A9P6WMK7_9ASCO|nr:hypothetical protein C6P40_004366 [[Candida] californica]